MRRTLLLCSVCLLTLLGNAQSQTVTTNPITEFSNPALNSQVAKINEKEAQIASATSSTRAVVAQLTEERQNLLKEYSTLLSNELSVTIDPIEQTELREELERINAILSNTKPSQR